MDNDANFNTKKDLVEQVLKYLLEHGINDLSLRPLAKSIGTNARMLMYYFGSKEQLIVEALELAQSLQRKALAAVPPPSDNLLEELNFLWAWFTNKEAIPMVKLFFAVETQSFQGNEMFKAFSEKTLLEWKGFIKGRLATSKNTESTLIVSMIIGLLFDHLIFEDKSQIDQAFKYFSKLLDA